MGVMKDKAIQKIDKKAKTGKGKGWAIC